MSGFWSKIRQAFVRAKWLRLIVEHVRDTVNQEDPGLASPDLGGVALAMWDDDAYLFGYMYGLCAATGVPMQYYFEALFGSTRTAGSAIYTLEKLKPKPKFQEGCSDGRAAAGDLVSNVTPSDQLSRHLRRERSARTAELLR